MNVTFIFALLRCSFAEPFSVSRDILFSTDCNFIDDLLKTSKLANAAGEQRLTVLKANPFAVYQNEIDMVAHDIRSSYVHGGEIGSKSQKEIKVVSQNIDAIVRKAYVKVIMFEWDKLITSVKVDEYFRNLLFPIEKD